MFYIVKRNDTHEVIEAKCNTYTQWRNAWGGDIHYEYYGINEDKGKSFDTRDIIKKSKAGTKNAVINRYPEYFL